MTFELNIVAAPPKPAARPAAPKLVAPSAPTATAVDAGSYSAPPVRSTEKSNYATPDPVPAPKKKRKVPIEYEAPAAAMPVPSVAPDEGAAPAEQTTKIAVAVKKNRYAKDGRPSASSREQEQRLLGKQDPSKAVALPATLHLEREPANPFATFSATTFGELPLDTYLQRHVTSKMGLERLTPVQQHAIPLILGGGDLLVRSPTGSGKTLAYALPIIQNLLRRGPGVVTRSAGTFAVVLVPTRELCLQTHECVEKLASPYPWLVTSSLMGGERRKAEKARLRKGVALLVGTPGRVADHAEATSAWQLRECCHLVLDEADRLLDLGFQRSIDTILDALDRARRVDETVHGASPLDPQPERPASAAAPRQTVLLSATLNKGLRELAGKSLKDYATLQLSHTGETEFTPPPSAAGSEGVGLSAATSHAFATAAASAAAAKATQAANLDAIAETGATAAGDDAGSDQKLDAPSGLLQSYALVPTRQRLTALLAFVRSRCMEAAAAGSGSEGAADCKMIIFVASCDEVDFLYELLSVSGEWPDVKEAMKAAGHATARDLVNKPGMWMGGEEEEEAEAEQARWWNADKGRSYGKGDEDDDGEGGGDDDDDDTGRDPGRSGKGRKPKAADKKALAKGVGKKAQGDGLSFECALLQCTMLRLHGKMSQRDRTQAFVRFRRMRSGVMICTDVAARGLNLEGVHWIVQQSLPTDAKEYLHRAGRTARLGQRGHAVLMLHPTELPFLSLLREAGVAPKELKFASLQAALCPGGGKKEIYVLELALQRQLETAVAEAAFLHDAASAAYQSYLKAYAAHSKTVRKLVHVGQLHLGHLAKSFGLREVPSRLSGQVQKRLANARQGQGTTSYLAGAEFVSKQERQELSGGGMYGKAGKKRKAGLPLAERMKRQKGARPVGVRHADVSEFGG